MKTFLKNPLFFAVFVNIHFFIDSATCGLSWRGRRALEPPPSPSWSCNNFLPQQPALHVWLHLPHTHASWQCHTRWYLESWVDLFKKILARFSAPFKARRRAGRSHRSKPDRMQQEDLFKSPPIYPGIPDIHPPQRNVTFLFLYFIFFLSNNQREQMKTGRLLWMSSKKSNTVQKLITVICCELKFIQRYTIANRNFFM